MNVQKIVLGVVIIILIYILYLYFFGDSRAVLAGIHDTSQEMVIGAASIPPGPTANFSYSIWVYVSNWNAGAEKIIFQRPCGTSFCPKMTFSSNMNNIDITLATYGTDDNSPKSATCTLENVPLQAWANIIMTLNGRALDLYLDGKLVRTCVMPGVPKLGGGGPLVLTPSNNSFQGYTANFQYYTRAVNPREAYAIYKEGYGGSNWFSNLFNKYRLKFSFLKDNMEVNSFEI